MQTAFLPFTAKVLGKMKHGKELLLHPAVPCRKQTQGGPGADELPLTVAAGTTDQCP